MEEGPNDTEAQEEALSEAESPEPTDSDEKL